MKNSQKGFTTTEILIFVVLIVLIAGAGWLVFDRQETESNPATGSSIQQPKSTPAKEAAPQESSIPEGWVQFKDAANKISFYHPPTLKGKFDVHTYKVGEEIPIGHGTPIWLVYSESSNSWQTYMIDDTSPPGNITKKLIDNSFQATKQQVGKSTILFSSGDGGASQSSVGFFASGKVYRIFFPELIEEIGEENLVDVEFQEQKSLQENSVEQIIQTVRVD